MSIVRCWPSDIADHTCLHTSFQSPIEVPGVSNIDFLRMACNARRKQLGKEDLPPLEFYAFLAPKVWACPAVQQQEPSLN